MGKRPCVHTRVTSGVTPCVILDVEGDYRSSWKAERRCTRAVPSVRLESLLPAWCDLIARYSLAVCRTDEQRTGADSGGCSARPHGSIEPRSVDQYRAPATAPVTRGPDTDIANARRPIPSYAPPPAPPQGAALTLRDALRARPRVPPSSIDLCASPHSWAADALEAGHLEAYSSSSRSHLLPPATARCRTPAGT